MFNKTKIHYNSRLLKLFPKKFYGFTFGKHIFFRKEESQVTEKQLTHEKVHAAQYKKYGVIKFLYIYLVKEWNVSYRQKTFEKEAYGDKD